MVETASAVAEALEKWLPPSCDADGVHISTGSYGQLNRARWAKLCPNLWQVDVATGHEDLLKGKAFENVESALVQSFQSANSVPEPTPPVPPELESAVS